MDGLFIYFNKKDQGCFIPKQKKHGILQRCNERLSLKQERPRLPKYCQKYIKQVPKNGMLNELKSTFSGFSFGLFSRIPWYSNCLLYTSRCV